MIRWGAAVVLACALAQPAWSLSCAPSDIARDFQRAAESDDTYIVVRGDLFFDETELPDHRDQRQSRQRDATDIAAWLTGHSLTPDGFTRRFERDVILRVSCLGPWCGGTANGAHLAFLRLEDRNWILRLSPCPGMAYANPTPEREQKVLACFRGESCVEQ
mgnify:CR=1 FL=1